MARNGRLVADQSHKREMNDAVRGDFERLRARRQRRARTAERPTPRQPERLVLTPPQPVADETEPQRVEAATETRATGEPAAPPPERRSWLRSLRRRE